MFSSDLLNVKLARHFFAQQKVVRLHKHIGPRLDIFHPGRNSRVQEGGLNRGQNGVQQKPVGAQDLGKIVEN